jgi:CubicO group peptidase (beta-lactamase class C family)
LKFRCRLALPGLLAIAFFLTIWAQSLDRVDRFVRAEMKKTQIHGLSLAIIENGEIVKARGYGVVEEGGAPVTESTLFQAGSISKPVAAVGALILVEQGKLSLDEDVNGRLNTWKLPENDLTRKNNVTLRGLLSHTAGMTVHGFPGYPSGGPIPTLVQVLNGESPANTGPVRVSTAPNSGWRYSGGGYTVVQQMVIDLTGKAYPQFMREAVLAPLGMERSTFEQPLPADWAKTAATGFYADGKQVPGRWHIYPEMAAAGLWTTSSDLARFVIALQRALAGHSGSVISQATAQEMLTPHSSSYGLGVLIDGPVFGHTGRDEGFDATLVAYAQTGRGVVIMINANDNSGVLPRIVRFVARQYRW